MKQCANGDCEEKAFSWAMDNHLEKCRYTEYQCFFCDEQITINSLKSHLKYDCNTLWVEKTEDTIAGSADLILRDLSKGDNLNVKLSIKGNIAVITNDIAIMFKWSEDSPCYKVNVIDTLQKSRHIKLTNEVVESTYAKEFFLSIKANNILKQETKELPKISSDINDVTIEIDCNFTIPA